ncbi:MAG: aromatic-ring-hydroxylating dioxygenase subunit beta [Rhodospirillales bacterium]|nr:aromatic-ring-hydroxylating dioxygenase subunit beta [Rhodospirillales bacterium]|tara:strand:- start:920 stop:1411 length:492 start_codon:yes stop_codon:yes gene_type:complete
MDKKTCFTIQEIETFLFMEARLLDERRYSDWLKLFSLTAWYWVPISKEQENPYDHVSIIYDDRKLLETRLRRLNNKNIHAENPPTQTSRIIGNVTLENIDETSCIVDVSSQFQIVEFRGNRQRIFAGKIMHHLSFNRNKFFIDGKRIDLVNAEGMMEGITILF